MPAPERQYRDRTVGRRRPKPEKRTKLLAPFGVSFSLDTFSWTSKRKYRDRGSRTAKNNLLKPDKNRAEWRDHLSPQYVARFRLLHERVDIRVE